MPESCNICSTIPQRWVTVLMISFGMLHTYAMRTCVAIAITEMVVPIDNSIKYTDDTCPGNISSIHSKTKNSDYNQLLHWSDYTQGIIMSSFFWGYVLSNIFGGMIAVKFGGRLTFGFTIISTSIFTILTPYVVKIGGSVSFTFLRFIMGLCEGIMHPTINTLIAQWIPMEDHGKAGAVSQCGGILGIILGFTFSGLILQYSTWGWPSAFYFFGGLGLFQSLLHSILCFSKPSDHPFISKAEAEYLKEKLKKYVHDELPPIPWRHILQSKPVWANLFASVGLAWSFLTVSTSIPKYISRVLKFSVQNNGYLVSLSYFSMLISSSVGSSISDWMVAKGQVSIDTVRKVGTTITLIGSGIFILAVSYAGCNSSIAVILLTIGMAFMGCLSFSITINILDLSPNYAGAISSLISSISTLSGIASPYIIGLITPNQTISEWRTVFWTIFIIAVVTNCIFLLYGKGELQEWNDPQFLKNESKEQCKCTDDVTEVSIQLLPIQT